MPILNWPGKHLRDPLSTRPRLEEVVFPNGTGYPVLRPANRLFQGDNFGIMSAPIPSRESRL